jgi:uncharacterized protein YbbC (DUF1343 family)
MQKSPVIPGAQVLLNNPELLPEGARVGLICNPTSITPSFAHLADALIDLPRVEVAVLFGPEHGIFATAQDMVGVAKQEYRGVPVVSLYGDTEQSLIPSADDLAGCDLLIADLQDVGSRYYTYAWTIAGCLEVCAKAGIPMMVCDRPNPLNGWEIEGPLMDDKFTSFVGRHPICTRHGLTVGEIAKLINEAKRIACDLTVVKCANWKRDDWFDQTGLPWVMPSPNMPSLETALVYPGGCLIEGTNLSEGRGTTRPFELVGAPFLDGNKLAEKLNAQKLPGVHFRPVQFEPTFHKHTGNSCGGVFVHVTDRQRFLPVQSYVALVIQARKLAPSDFAWRTEKYEFVSEHPAIDLLFGDDKPRLAIEGGAELKDVTAHWEDDNVEFFHRRAPFLLYD